MARGQDLAPWTYVCLYFLRLFTSGTILLSWIVWVGSEWKYYGLGFKFYFTLPLFMEMTDKSTYAIYLISNGDQNPRFCYSLILSVMSTIFFNKNLPIINCTTMLSCMAIIKLNWSNFPYVLVIFVLA